MSDLRVDRCIVTRLLSVLVLGTGTPALHAQQQVQVIVTALPNPVPAGSCTGIWVEVRNEFNQRISKLPNGLELHSRSYDYSQPNAVDFAWKNNEPSIGYLCARATGGATSTVVTATIRGTTYSGTTVVTLQPATSAAVAANTAPSAAAPAPVSPPPAAPVGVPPASQSQPPSSTAPTGYGQPPANASSPGYGQPPAVTNAPTSNGQPSVPPPGSSTTGAAQPPSGQPPITAASDPGQPYPPPASPTPPSTTQPPPPAPAASAPGLPGPASTTGVVTPGSPAPAEAEPGIKSGGQFVKKITGHTKRKAGQVTAETAENVANATNEVIDTTLETGSGLVSATAAEAGNKARIGVGGAGKSLLPAEQRGGESSDNLAVALATGRAILRSIRFTGTTDVLEPSARELVKRLAEVLKATPGTFLIEDHVDAMPSPTAAQELSEHRAAAVKAALIKHGVPVARLTALGYGATRPMPEVPADGGPPSSARIEVARKQ